MNASLCGGQEQRKGRRAGARDARSGGGACGKVLERLSDEAWSGKRGGFARVRVFSKKLFGRGGALGGAERVARGDP